MTVATNKEQRARHACRDVRRAGGLLRRIRSNELGMPAEMSQRDPFGMRRAG